MDNSREEVKHQFFLKLESFLVDQSASTLVEANYLGETAIKEGIGELDIMSIYYEAMAKIHVWYRQNGKGAEFKNSVEFLSECLAPYEMRSQGYQELIKKLDLRNNQLQREVDRRKLTEERLSKSEAYFKNLIENTLDIITVLNNDGSIRYISPSLKRIMGYDPEELMGKYIVNYIHPDNRQPVTIRLHRLYKTEKKMDLSEFRFRHKNGSWRYLESVAHFVSDSDKEEAPYIIVNSRDISERVTVREKLQKRKQQLTTAQEIAQLGSWEWEFRNDLLRWSRELSRIYGIEHENAPSSLKNEPQIIHPDDLKSAKKAMQQALVERGKVDFEHRIVRPDGEERVLHVRGEVICDDEGHPVKMIGTGQDITDLKKVEKKLQAYSELLRNLYAKQDRIREDERIRVAREIHDELGQMLTVLKMELYLLKEKTIEEQESQLDVNFIREVESIIERFDTIINSVQRITTDLRPEVLDTLGLNEAIEWQCRKFEAESDIKISFASIIESVDPVDDERSTAIFRILQETFSNIQEHAEATKVEVHLKKDDQHVVLIVHDNGRGISRDKINAPDSLGIIGMYERSQFLGGDIIFRGNRNEGTTVILKIPL
ncbi:MAG: PAS domain-containing protein [Balneolaceae bacterium]